MVNRIRGFLAGFAVAVGGATAAPVFAQETQAPQQPAVTTVVADNNANANNNTPVFNGDEDAFLGIAATGEKIGYVGGKVGTFTISDAGLANELAQAGAKNNGFFSVDSDNDDNYFQTGFKVATGADAVAIAAQLKTIDPAKIYTFEFVQGKQNADGSYAVEGKALAHPVVDVAAAKDAAQDLTRVAEKTEKAEQARLAAAAAVPQPVVATSGEQVARFMGWKPESERTADPVTANTATTQPNTDGTTVVVNPSPEQTARLMGWRPDSEKTGATTTVTADAAASTTTTVVTNDSGTPVVTDGSNAVVTTDNAGTDANAQTQVAAGKTNVGAAQDNSATATTLTVESGEQGFLMLHDEATLLIFPGSKQVAKVTVDKAALAAQFEQDKAGRASEYFPQSRAWGNPNSYNFELLSSAEAASVLQIANNILNDAIGQIDNPETIAVAKTDEGFTQNGDKGDGLLYSLSAVRVNGDRVECNGLVLLGDNVHGGRGDITAFIDGLKAAQSSIVTIAQVQKIDLMATTVASTNDATSSNATSSDSNSATAVQPGNGQVVTGPTVVAADSGNNNGNGATTTAQPGSEQVITTGPTVVAPDNGTGANTATPPVDLAIAPGLTPPAATNDTTAPANTTATNDTTTTPPGDLAVAPGLTLPDDPAHGAAPAGADADAAGPKDAGASGTTASPDAGKTDDKGTTPPGGESPPPPKETKGFWGSEWVKMALSALAGATLVGLGWLRSRSKVNQKVDKLALEMGLLRQQMQDQAEAHDFMFKKLLTAVLDPEQAKKEPINPEHWGYQWDKQPGQPRTLVRKPDPIVAFKQYGDLRAAVESLAKDLPLGTAVQLLSDTAGYAQGSDDLPRVNDQLAGAVIDLMRGHPDREKVGRVRHILEGYGIDIPDLTQPAPAGGTRSWHAPISAAIIGAVSLGSAFAALNNNASPNITNPYGAPTRVVETTYATASTRTMPAVTQGSIDYGNGVVQKVTFQDASVGNDNGSPYGTFITGPMFAAITMKVRTI